MLLRESEDEGGDGGIGLPHDDHVGTGGGLPNAVEGFSARLRAGLEAVIGDPGVQECRPEVPQHRLDVRI